ncbi:tRNA wybutosine-synthesizing protein 2 homolog [Lingula anatina]|uniref:tRNA wybutosine-synthesizing protein 2 homolog n=1 Tax=Lingula anatina TaxID=7574 RepID=A0A1S3HU36_LINAN|nr:tRNA wybutosine-synthesizing protein 2 homolog [Lingula anatina]|eukprot:XP_013389560.1 tRNA wybutosine-synthesizing protein 2 homolog [Lingula anatina]
MSAPTGVPVVIIPKTSAQTVRKHLEIGRLWDSRYSLKKINKDLVAIPITSEAYKMLTLTTGALPATIEYTLDVINLSPSKKDLLKPPQEQLRETLGNLLEIVNSEKKTAGVRDGETWEDDIPKHWEKHGDMVVLPDHCFKNDFWRHCGPQLWETVARILGAKRLAKKSVISQDGFRTPQVELLLGKDGWVTHIDNQIKYSYDVTRCMFSAGNITEKLRVAHFHCEGETVVDLYAGTGYFTLPYLIHAKARLVHACEWNPDAADALRKNLHLNGVAERCIVHQGDNRLVCPKGVADRVNLGLIPSSEEGWPVACAALKSQSGGILHIHYNVETKTPEHRNDSRKETANLVREHGNGDFNETSSLEHLQLQRSQCDSRGVCPCNKTKSETCFGISQLAGGLHWCEDTKSMENTLQNNDQSNECNSVNTAQDTGCPSLTGMSVPVTCHCGSKHLGKSLTGEHVKQHSGYHYDERATSNQTSDTAVTCNKKLLPQWKTWAVTTAGQIRDILHKTHGGQWKTEILHLEHVKSYAPHVDHMVLDLLCKPA